MNTSDKLVENVEYLRNRGYSIRFDDGEFSVGVVIFRDDEKVFEYNETKADAMNILEKTSVSAKQGYLPIDLLEQMAINHIYRVGVNKFVALIKLKDDEI